MVQVVTDTESLFKLDKKFIL